MITIIILLGGAFLTTFASFVFAIPWLMPILGTLVIYPIFLLQVSNRQYKAALGWVLLWAIFQSLAVIIGTIFAHETASKVVLTGAIYTEEMFHWIRTGEGAEGSLSLFLPIHLKHYAAFCFLSLITLGLASLLLGTYLLNYMNFYVASLIKASIHPWIAAIIGWPVWSILRVIGFICTGIALTALGLSIINKIRDKESQITFPKKYLFMGIGFVIADIIVKAILAPIWQKMLLFALG